MTGDRAGEAKEDPNTRPPQEGPNMRPPPSDLSPDGCQQADECLQPEKISVPVQCHDGEDDKMEGLADPKVSL